MKLQLRLQFRWGELSGKFWKLSLDFPKIGKAPTQYKNAVGGDFLGILAPQAANFSGIFHI